MHFKTNTFPCKPKPIPIMDAVRDAPTLATLAHRGSLAITCLKAIQHLLPPGVAANTQAGPLEDGTLCLLAGNSAVAAKLRQLQPAVLTFFANTYVPVKALRIKVAANGRNGS